MLISILIISATNYRLRKDQLYRFTDVTVKDFAWRLEGLNYASALTSVYRRS